MKARSLLACLLTLPAAVTLAAEQFKCSLVTDAGNGEHQWHADQYVKLTLDQELVQSRIHIRNASKDLTFADCAKTKADGSNFSRWFATECRKLASLDGSSFSVDVYMIDAYAGISPPVEAGYEMYTILSAIGAKLGVGTPARTFVIYADRKPQYEFFCYRQDMALKPAK
jgi:hypothetical protein